MRAIIVHGWDGYPGEGWFPWLKKELEKKKFKVIVPKMPTQPPTMKDWVHHLSKKIGKPDKDTYLILKFLETCAFMRRMKAGTLKEIRKETCTFRCR